MPFFSRLLFFGRELERPKKRRLQEQPRIEHRSARPLEKALYSCWVLVKGFNLSYHIKENPIIYYRSLLW